MKKFIALVLALVSVSFLFPAIQVYAVETLPPADPAQAAAAPVVITTVTLPLYPNSSSNWNAEVACNYLNGYVIKSGAPFSYNMAVGQRTADRGFKPAPIIVNKKNEIGYGGGVCKISSAMYNLALQTGLPVLERHGHSHDIGYVKAGYDATVSWGTADLVFVNTSPVDLVISAYKDQSGFHLAFLSAPVNS